MRKVASGRIIIREVKDGQPGVTRDITAMGGRDAGLAGLANIPEDRRGSGLVLTDSIEGNAILGRVRWPQFSRNGFLLRLSDIAAWAKKLVSDFDVRTPSTAVPARALSGGNQQKIIIAREFGS